MKIRFSAAALAVAAAFPVTAWAHTAETSLGEVMVSATRIEMPDVAAPYALEVHTRAQIERSGATTLYDYLARQTSLQVMPSYGNRLAPSINLRGYGMSDGHQNVVIAVDGRRLNNIDMAAQLIGTIPLAAIERIEITKGSGSVMFGDGAAAGVVQIHTKAREGASVEAFGGSHGSVGGTLSAGLVQDRFSVAAMADHIRSDGFSAKDPTGHRDASTSDAWQVNLSGRPADRIRVHLDAGASRIDGRAPERLSLAEFRDNPAQNNGRTYNLHQLASDYWGAGVDYDLNDLWRVTARYVEERKTSKFFGSRQMAQDYLYRSHDVSLQYLGEQLSATFGVQDFDGEREGEDNTTSKRNLGWYAQGQYVFERLTLSAGVRGERVQYEYQPVAGARLKQEENLSAWDVGANYRVTPALSLFGSYNSAFQAPDIDRFFRGVYDSNWELIGTEFNDMISPAKVRTTTLGFNHVVPGNRLKVAVFHAQLKDEIYLEPLSYANTNIDKSHKYGFEIQDAWLVATGVTALLNYSWTRAVIDREDQGGGAYDGKELPGVPRHNLIVGLNAKVGDKGNFQVSHTWRSKAWTNGDFGNNNVQRQREYQTTDLAYRHRLEKRVELYAAVTNLFERRNGVDVRSARTAPYDFVYPVDFERTWKVGARVSF